MSLDTLVGVLLVVAIVGYVSYGFGYQRGQDAEKRKMSDYGGTNED